MTIRYKRTSRLDHRSQRVRLPIACLHNAGVMPWSGLPANYPDRHLGKASNIRPPRSRFSRF